MTTITLASFLPQPSFFTVPDRIQARSEEDLLVGKVAQCLLALHRIPREATLAPGSASLKLISDTASKVHAPVQTCQSQEALQLLPQLLYLQLAGSQLGCYL